MKKIVLSDAFLTGHPVIDAEHRNLVDLLNDCIDLVNAGAVQPAVQKKVAALYEMLCAHIRHEEGIMDEIGYAITVREKQYHAKGLREFDQLMERHADGADMKTYMQDLRGVLLETFLKTDMGLKSFFPEIGYRG